MAPQHRHAGEQLAFGDGQIIRTYYNHEKGPTYAERLALPLIVVPTAEKGVGLQPRMLGTAFAVRPAVYLTARHVLLDVLEDVMASRLKLAVLFFPDPLEDGTPVNPFPLDVTFSNMAQEKDHDVAMLTTSMPVLDGTLHKT